MKRFEFFQDHSFYSLPHIFMYAIVPMLYALYSGDWGQNTGSCGDRSIHEMGPCGYRPVCSRTQFIHRWTGTSVYSILTGFLGNRQLEKLQLLP